MATQEIQGAVVSSIPGRLRVRVSKPHRHHQSVQDAENHLRQHPGVHAVETNHKTGSVMVKYDPSKTSAKDILGLMKDVGLVAMGTAAGLGIELPDAGRSKTSVNIIAATDDLDRRISWLTGRRVDLKFLVPAGLFALGIRQVAAAGLGLAEVPGYILLWYAFDTFWKFHQQEPVVARRARHIPVEPIGPEDDHEGARHEAHDLNDNSA